MSKLWDVPDVNAGRLFSAERMVGGFSAEEINFLCDSERAKRERRRYSPVPWLHWGSEQYSFGRCFREISGFPRWLPIAVNSDHGTGLKQALLEVEKAVPAKVHLVWSAWRVGNWNNEKEFHRTLHPWVAFRRLRGLVAKPSARGTLVFLPHSTARDNEHEEDGWGGLVDKAKSLPISFQPVVFCIQMHDVRKRKHSPLLLAGHKVVTFGESTSPFFVERFYSGIANFKYSASCDIGSHSFICEEAGVDFFLLGEPSKSSDSVIAGGRGQSVESYRYEFESQQKFRQEYFENLFSDCPPVKSVEKERFIREAMGLDLTTQEAGERIRKLFWSQLLGNLHKILWLYGEKFWLKMRLRP